MAALLFSYELVQNRPLYESLIQVPVDPLRLIGDHGVPAFAVHLVEIGVQDAHAD